MTLRCSLLNCHGLVTRRTNKLKTDEFKTIFNSSDIVLLTETWTDDFSDTNVANFESFILNRHEVKRNSKRNSGGLIVYVRDKYVSRDMLVYTSADDIVWIKINKYILSLEQDLYICLCYVTPDDSSRQSIIETNIFDRLLESVLFVENKTQNNCNIVICGDFNSRTSVNPDFVSDDDPVHMSVLPDDYSPDGFMQRFSEDEGHTNNNGVLFLDFCKQTGMRIMNGRVGNDHGVGRYTFVGHRGCSLVDYVISKPDLFEFVKSFEVQEPNILSDHCVVTFSFEFGTHESENMLNTNYSYVTGKYIWNNEAKDEFLDKLECRATTEKLTSLNEKISSCSDSSNIKSCLSDFVNIIEDVSSSFFKKARGTNQENVTQNGISQITCCSESNINPWYNEECHEKKYVFLYMLDKYRECKSDINRINMVKARSDYKQLIRKCRFNYDREKTNTFVNAKFKNAKLYWNMLKELANVKPSVPLSSFEQYFRAVNNPSDPFYTPDEDITHFNERYANNEFNIMFDELNLNFTHEEILQSIKQLKLNKSAGPDKLLNEFLIYGKHVLTPILCNLFNKIFESGYFPEDWSEGHIIPLHKKGSLINVENYRGITLLSVLGKLFSRVLNNRLRDWTEKYHILIEAQAGFRPGMSTVDNIYVLHGLITHIVNQGKKLYCAFVDFTKAFDYVVRENLWFKMIKYGLRGRILNIIMSMYSAVKSRLKVDNKLGNEFYCSLGVRQGECLSPLLFSLFLNDIEEQFIQHGMEGLDTDIIKIFMLLYADDIVIFANSAEKLQESLNILSDYCRRWKLCINVTKTKIMVFRKGGLLNRDLAFYYENNQLEIVKSFRYLGIVFTVGGSFTEAQNTLSGQAQKAIFKLNKYLYKFTFISPKHKLELFDKLILPILNYGSEVWGFVQANAIERVHLQFCKRLLGVKKTTQNDFVYGELGRSNIITKRYLIILKYWFKVLMSPNNKYINLVYRLMLNDMELRPNTVNWAALVRHLLLSLGFYEVWLNQGVGDYNIFISLLKQRLTDIFIQNWRARLEASTRANFYTSISIFQFQPYLEKINITKFIQAFSRLRMSSHRLEVESGRWVRPNSIPLNDRKCRFCNVLEDEFHFIIECNMFTELRKRYIPKFYLKRPSMIKFIDLINSTNERCIRKLSTFIFQAFKLRSELLYRR